MLRVNAWILLNDSVYVIYNEKNINRMREILFQKLANLIMFDAGSFYLAKKGEKPGLCEPIGYQLAEEQLQYYIHHYKEYDPIIGGLMHSNKSYVYRESSMMSEEELMESEYYKRVYGTGRNSYFHSLHLNIVEQGVFVGILSLFRLNGKADFSDDDLMVLNMLQDHLSARLYADYMERQEEQIYISDFIKKYQLTERESQVLRGAVKRKTNEELCRELEIKQNTLKKHFMNIYDKTGINSRIRLLQKVREAEPSSCSRDVLML